MNMKKITTIITALSTVLLIQEANAGFYMGANISGYSKADLEKTIQDKDAMFWSVALGYKLPFLIPLSIEAEYSQNKLEMDTMKTFNANAYFFVPFIPIVSPYVGVGVGNTKVKLETEAKNNLLTQYMGGVMVKVPFFPVAANIEYRYMDFHKNNISQIVMGIKYMF